MSPTSPTSPIPPIPPSSAPLSASAPPGAPGDAYAGSRPGAQPTAPAQAHRSTPGASPSFSVTAQPYVLAAFRIVIGGLFACHGAASLFGVLGGAMGGGTVPQFEWPGWYAAAIQLLCGCLVLLGLGTRSAALLASGSMAFAYFTVHQPHALAPIQNNGEPAAVFCWTFFLLVFTGPGTFALDSLFRRSR